MKVFSVILFIILSMAFSNLNSQNSTWVKAPIDINSENNDYTQLLKYYDGKTKLRFGIGNDSSNLYLLFQEVDESIQFQIFNSGINISVKTGQKPRVWAKFSLLPMKLSDNRSFAENFSITALKEKVILNKPNMQVKELLNLKEHTLPLDVIGKLSYSLKWENDNSVIIAITIPLSELFDDYIKDITKKDVSLVVNINGLEKADISSSINERPQQSLSQGGFGRQNSQPRPWGSTFENSYTTIIMETLTFRQNFKLATGK